MTHRGTSMADYGTGVYGPILPWPPAGMDAAGIKAGAGCVSTGMTQLLIHNRTGTCRRVLAKNRFWKRRNTRA